MRTLFIFLALTTVLTFSTSEVEAKDINFTITDVNGCEWEVDGVINFTVWGTVESYDVTLTRKPGTGCEEVEYHFVGIYHAGGGTNGTDVDMALFDEFETEIPLTTIDYMYFYNAMEDQGSD